MKVDFKTIMIVALAAVIIFLIPKACSAEKVGATKQTTTTTISYKDEVDSLKNYIANQKPDSVPYLVYKDRIVPAKSSSVTQSGDIDWIKDGEQAPGEEFEFMFLNVYKDTLRLANGEIYSEIVTDGKVYENKSTLKTTEKTVTVTNTKEVKIYGSGFFLSGGTGVNSGTRIDNVNAGLDYIYQNDVGIGLNVQYNLTTKEPVFGVRVLKKIF